MTRVREAVSTVKKVLTGSLEDMTANQTTALQERERLHALVERYQRRRAFYRAAPLWIAGVGTLLAALYGLYAALAWLVHVFGGSLAPMNLGQLTAFLLLVGLCLSGIGGLWRWDYERTGQALSLRYPSWIQAGSLVETVGARKNQALQATRQSRFADHQERYAREVAAAEQQLRRELTPFTPELQRYQQEDGPIVSDWRSPLWGLWRPRFHYRELDDTLTSHKAGR